MTAPVPLGRVVATPGVVNLLRKSGGTRSTIWPAMPQVTGESCAPLIAARTRSPCARAIASSAPTQ
jgi:hypothetical protein